MRNRFFYVLGCGLFASAMPALVHADSGTAGFSFLNIPVGARATALGQAFTSIQNDIQALPYNPACLATLVNSQASFQHLSYVEDTIQEAASFGHAAGPDGLSWGASANYLRVSNIPRTIATDPSAPGDGFIEAGDFSTYDMALGLSTAYSPVEDLAVGGTVKLLRESLADASSNAGAVDVGVLYQLSESHPWTVGGSLENLGFASRFADAAVKLPSTFRVGISGQPYAQWLIATDFVKRTDTQGALDAGLEFSPRSIVSFRMGYSYAFASPDLGALSSISAGFGLHFDRLSVDYAFVPLGDLGLTHRISLSFRFKSQHD